MTFGANRTNAGWYFCIAENEYGIQKSKEIQLIVAGELNSEIQHANYNQNSVI